MRDRPNKSADSAASAGTSAAGQPRPQVTFERSHRFDAGSSGKDIGDHT